MKFKKIPLLLIIIFCLAGCVNLNSLSYDNIINNLIIKRKPANVFKKGHQFYVPKGLHVSDSGPNYVILSSNDAFYYLYIDLVSYNAKKNSSYEINDKALYSTRINYDGKSGYVEIKLWENNQYLIEIMYNYAKIEVMVDESLINKALANSISILCSIKYNDVIIKNLLNDDNLTYTEEVFDMFEDVEENSSNLNYEESIIEEEEQEEIKDTDFLN